MASDTIRKRLNQLHDEDGLTWRQIAEMPEFKPVPAGTLCSFAKGNYEPKINNKYRRVLGLPELITQEVIRDAKGRFISRG